MDRFGLVTFACLVLVAPAFASSEAPGGVDPFFGNFKELKGPIHVRARPGWKSTCLLEQTVETVEDLAAKQFVTFDTVVEGTPDAAVIIQTVKGHEDTLESPALFGYQHRITLDPSGVPVATEARAIEGFPISNRDLRQAALDGKVDIRDSIFSGRTFVLGDLINHRAEETFRFLKPILPRNLSMDTMVDHSDSSQLVGLIESDQGRPTLLFRLDTDTTNVRRSSATNSVLRGHLLLDIESGLIAGEKWSARIDRTSEKPFEIVTKVECFVGSVN